VARRRRRDLLACSADVLPATLKRLSMFVLRARCKLSDASGDLALYGLAAARVPRAGWERARPRRPGNAAGSPAATPSACPTQTASRATCGLAPAAEPPGAAALDADAWRWLEVPAAWCASRRHREQFVPQMVNLELVGGVNFQKGCYPGQEVVARSQYRGTLKRRRTISTCGSPASSNAAPRSTKPARA
jgi:tRNA-modifying protein YgfZ